MVLNQEQSRPRPTLYLVIKLTCGLVYDIAEAWEGSNRPFAHNASQIATFSAAPSRYACEKKRDEFIEIDQKHSNHFKTTISSRFSLHSSADVCQPGDLKQGSGSRNLP
jgi:hypothetical protein